VSDELESGGFRPFIIRAVRFTVRFYIPILLLSILVSWISFNTARHLKLQTDIISLMPDGVPSVSNLQKVIDKTGGYSNAMVLVESKDKDASVRFLEALRTEVLKNEWVGSAEYYEDTSIFEANRLLYVDAADLKEINRRLAARIDYEKKNLKFKVQDTTVNINIRGSDGRAPPPLNFDDIKKKYESRSVATSDQKLFRNEAGDLTILLVLPKGSTTNVNYARRVVNDLKRDIAKVDSRKYSQELKVQLGGRVTNLVANFDTINSDVVGSALWAISSVFLVVVLFYRRITAILYIGIPLVAGFLWTFAVTQLVHGSLNLITIFLVIILFGLGIDFGIHNLARYDEIRRNGGTMENALATIFERTGFASLLAAITTIAGFYSLMATDFRAFSEFGFIAGTGVGFTLISMYVVFPAVIVLAEKTRFYRPPHWGKKLFHKPRIPTPYRWVGPILTVGLVSVVVALYFSLGLRFEDDFSRLKTKSPEIEEINERIKEVFPLRSDKAVVFVDTLQEVRGVVDAVESIRELGEITGRDTIEKVKSIISVVPELSDQKDRLEEIDKIHANIAEAIRLLDEFGARGDKRREDLEKFIKYVGISELKPEALPSALQRVYTGVPGSGGYLVYIYNRKGAGKLDEAQAFVDDIREIRANGKIYHPATEAMVFVDMLNLMKKDSALAVGAVVASVVIVLLIAFRSIPITLLLLVPVSVGILWMFAIMVLFGLRLNIFNMVVLPTLFGIGIDNAIHLYHRFQEEREYVRYVVTTTGGAAFLTTITTMLGFAGTISASNQGLQSLGIVACIGLGACLVSSLTIFPALLQFLHDRHVARKQQISVTESAG